jgi:hypothetical protein
VKALKLVSNIEVRTQWCFCLFLAATEGSYDVIKHELVSLRRAAQDIRHNTDCVKSRKEEVLNSLDQLESQLLQSLDYPDDSSQGPVLAPRKSILFCATRILNIHVSASLATPRHYSPRRVLDPYPCLHDTPLF